MSCEKILNSCGHSISLDLAVLDEQSRNKPYNFGLKKKEFKICVSKKLQRPPSCLSLKGPSSDTTHMVDLQPQPISWL